MIGIEYVDAGIFMVTNTLSSTLFYEIIGPTRMELEVDVCEGRCRTRTDVKLSTDVQVALL